MTDVLRAHRLDRVIPGLLHLLCWQPNIGGTEVFLRSMFVLHRCEVTVAEVKYMINTQFRSFVEREHGR
jgi:hypothetical protein